MSASASDTGERHPLLDTILAGSSAEILVFDAVSLHIVEASPAAARNLRRTLSALCKLTPLAFIVADDVRAFNTRLAQLRSGKKSRTSLNLHFRRRDDTRYPTRAQLFLTHDRGQPVFVCIAEDVSQADAMRQALAHTASDLHAIVAHIPGMAFQILKTADSPPRFSYVSAQSAQLLGIEAAALRARPERFARLILTTDRAPYQLQCAAAEGGHMSFNWEGRIRMAAWKDVKWISIRVSQRDAPEGRVWDGIILNVTHSKLAEAALRESRHELAALAAHVETLKEQERLNIAREVHDDLGGSLTAIRIGLSLLQRRLPADATDLRERTAYLDQIVNQSIDATHRIAASLRPPVLDFGIVAAIEWQLQRFAQSTDITYQLDAPAATIPLDADTAITVFRIVQEALTNVAKHAQATQVHVALATSAGELLVTVSDNGRGIAATRGKPNQPGFGIRGMRERAAVLGGELTLLSATPRGTRVSLRIKLPGLSKMTA
jgi:two-component system sensor histidine kinase UhpB